MYLCVFVDVVYFSNCAQWGIKVEPKKLNKEKFEAISRIMGSTYFDGVKREEVCMYVCCFN